MKHAVTSLALALALAGGATAVGDTGFGDGGVVKNAHPVLLEQNGDMIAFDYRSFGSTVFLFRLTPTGSRQPFAYQPNDCGPQFAVRADATLVAACGGTIQRLRPDGRTDGGRVDIPGVRLTGIAVGADGTVAAGGQAADGTTVLLRFLPDDTPDAQFGRVVVPGPPLTRQGLAVDSVGRILTANGELRRYLANGQEDPAFTPPSSAGRLVALTADGRIDVCCASGSLYRLLADGTPDPSFGLQGAAALIAPPDEGFYPGALAPEPDGATVLVGGMGPTRPLAGEGYIAFYAQRIRPDGSLGAVGESPGFFEPTTTAGTRAAIGSGSPGRARSSSEARRAATKSSSRCVTPTCCTATTARFSRSHSTSGRHGRR